MVINSYAASNHKICSDSIKILWRIKHVIPETVQAKFVEYPPDMKIHSEVKMKIKTNLLLFCQWQC